MDNKLYYKHNKEGTYCTCLVNKFSTNLQINKKEIYQIKSILLYGMSNVKKDRVEYVK